MYYYKYQNTKLFQNITVVYVDPCRKIYKNYYRDNAKVKNVLRCNFYRKTGRKFRIKIFACTFSGVFLGLNRDYGGRACLALKSLFLEDPPK